MFRSKLLLIILSGALVFGACDDTSTDSGDNGDDGNGNGEEPVEPTASVNNPSDGATLEGEITFSVDGESEEGFEEARIFVGDEQVETVSDPSLPHDETIDTRNYNNGDYDLRAELDVIEPDSTIETSVSVTLENYLLEIDTNGRISQMKDETALEDELLLVADPDGNVLKKIDMLQQSDGTLQILAPEELPEDGAPEHFTVTQVSNVPDQMGNASLSIYTDVGFQPWTDVTSEDLSGGDDSTPDSTDITMDFTNIPDNYDLLDFLTTENDYSDISMSSAEPFSGTFTFVKDLDNLIVTTHPSNNDYGTAPPLYYWEESLENGQTLSLDVGQDFSEMATHSVDWPTDFGLGSSYEYSMSIDPGSFDAGGMGFFSFANNISSGSNTMYVPNTDHQYLTDFVGIDIVDDDFVQYTHFRSGDLPGSFSRLDYEITHDNTSMDNTQLSVQGNDSPDVAFHIRSAQEGHTWFVALPPDTTEFVYPKIADSLGQSLTSNYNRSSFEPNVLQVMDLPDVDGFDAYFEEFFVLSNLLFSQQRHSKLRAYDVFQSRLGKQDIEPVQFVEDARTGKVPVVKTDQWGNKYSPLLEWLNE